MKVFDNEGNVVEARHPLTNCPIDSNVSATLRMEKMGRVWTSRRW